MLKVPFKKIQQLFTPKEINHYIIDNFQDLKNQDIIKLKTLIKLLHKDSKQFEKKFWAAFEPPLDLRKPIATFRLAYIMTLKTLGDHLSYHDAVSTPEFWQYARRIADYKCDSSGHCKEMQKKRQYLTKHK